MYKIKNNVPLDILKEYGFVENNGYMRIIEKDNITKQCFVFVDDAINFNLGILNVPRALYLCTPLSVVAISENNKWVINDLLNANLIEELESKDEN